MFKSLSLCKTWKALATLKKITLKQDVVKYIQTYGKLLIFFFPEPLRPVTVYDCAHTLTPFMHSQAH